MGWIYIGLIVAIVGMPGPPLDPKALEDFARLQHEIGQRVYVTDHEGVERVGTLSAATVSDLTLDLGRHAQQMHADQIQAVDGYDDPITDGLVKGALIGGLLGLVAIQARGSSGGVWKPILGGVAFYGGIGALFDRGHHARTPIYRTPPATIVVRLRW
jgi:hypothetical protein